MVTAYFIDESWLKEKTPINDNVDVKVIVPFLDVAQDLHLQPLLGSALYNRLMSGVVNSNLNANETALIRLLQPALAYYTVCVAIPFVATQIRAAGIVKTRSETIEAASKSEVDALRTASENMADFYGERVTRYLCVNSGLFPEYTTSTDMVPNNSTPYNGGFYFGDDGCGCDLSLGTCNCG